MTTDHSTVFPTETKPHRLMNVYIVWTEHLCEDGWRYDYYQFIEARTPSAAKYIYADEGGWGDEVFQKQPEGFAMHCNLVESNTNYGISILDHYAEHAGVDLMLAGVITPAWMWGERLGNHDRYDYRRWDGFRKPRTDEFEHADAAPPAGEGE